MKREKNRQLPITIVSGLPRSGTTMMMRMLEAGGLEVFTDGIRKADKDNPKGYYEYEKVKKLKDDSAWLKNACGKCIKIISALLSHVPDSLSYKIIFMRRHMPEILASQRKMLERSGKATDDVPDKIMAAKFEMHLSYIFNWMKKQKNMDVLYVDYNDVISNPRKNADDINAFMDNKLNVDDMVQIVDNSLYRQRRK